MLERRSSYSKLQGCTLIVRIFEHTMDEATGERITTTYAIDNRVDIVALRLIELLAIVDECFPAVVGSGE